jgi:hypothetical protein
VQIESLLSPSVFSFIAAYFLAADMKVVAEIENIGDLMRTFGLFGSVRQMTLAR